MIIHPQLGAVPAILALGAALSAQQTDWAEVATRAVEHPRYAMRRAAAGKIAQAGDAAVPALRELIEARGEHAIPLELVDAIAKADTDGPATLALLRDWADDRDFYWRSQALDGLAGRHRPEDRPRFASAVEDPSHLYRIAGARGLFHEPNDDELATVRALLADPDPRTRLRIALLLLESDDRSGLGEIVAAIDRQHLTFLDDPWGEREARRALRELSRLTGEDLSAALTGGATNRVMARLRLGELATEAGVEIPETRGGKGTYIGGLEIRSCRNGDLYLRWTERGLLAFGLDPLQTTRLAPEDWLELRRSMPDLAGAKVHGRVVCDFARLYTPLPSGGEIHRKAAPGALPSSAAEWLKALSQAIEKTDSAQLANQLDTRLEQFLPRRKE